MSNEWGCVLRGQDRRKVFSLLSSHGVVVVDSTDTYAGLDGTEFVLVVDSSDEEKVRIIFNRYKIPILRAG